MKYFFISLFFFSTTVLSKVIDFDLLKDKTLVVFEAKGSPSILSIKGMKAKGSGQLKITEGLLSGDISVELNDFDTDMDTRNEHMKEKYLETGKSGFNISKLKLISIPINNDFPEKIKTIENQSIEAILTLHGVEKKIICQMTMNSVSPEEIAGTVNFKIKLTDFGIEIPSFAGITIENEVVVKSEYVAKTITTKKL
jgi:hypothetical protein